MLSPRKAKRTIRKGGRVYGVVFCMPNGKEVYLAYRKIGEMVRGDEKYLFTHAALLPPWPDRLRIR